MFTVKARGMHHTERMASPVMDASLRVTCSYCTEPAIAIVDRKPYCRHHIYKSADPKLQPPQFDERGVRTNARPKRPLLGRSQPIGLTRETAPMLSGSIIPMERIHPKSPARRS